LLERKDNRNVVQQYDGRPGSIKITVVNRDALHTPRRLRERDKMGPRKGGKIFLKEANTDDHSTAISATYVVRREASNLKEYTLREQNRQKESPGSGALRPPQAIVDVEARNSQIRKAKFC